MAYSLLRTMPIAVENRYECALSLMPSWPNTVPNCNMRALRITSFIFLTLDGCMCWGAVLNPPNCAVSETIEDQEHFDRALLSLTNTQSTKFLIQPGRTDRMNIEI